MANKPRQRPCSECGEMMPITNAKQVSCSDACRSRRARRLAKARKAEGGALDKLNQTHPFQVAVHVLIGKGSWEELARCDTRKHANDVADALSLVYSWVQVAELRDHLMGGQEWVVIRSLTMAARSQ